MGATVTTQVPVLTANNVSFRIGGVAVALVQSISITRTIGRRPVYQIGTPLFADPPATQASVTMTVTNMVPKTGSLGTLNLAPNGSLVEAVDADPIATISIVSETGTTIANVQNGYWASDTLTTTSNEPLTISAQFIAQDTQAFI